MKAHSAVLAPRTDAQDVIDETRPRADCDTLLKLLNDNPEAGANELFRCFSGEVNRLVWRTLGADPDHNDLVQQVFCKLLTKWRSVRDPARLPGWVQAVTLNTVYQELRKRDIRRLFLRNMDQPKPYRDMALEVEERDLLEAAFSILRDLPAKQRIAFVLRHVEGESLERVAELCDVSVGTVKRRLRSGNKRFEQRVSAHPELLARLQVRNRDKRRS